MPADLRPTRSRARQLRGLQLRLPGAMVDDDRRGYPAGMLHTAIRDGTGQDRMTRCRTGRPRPQRRDPAAIARAARRVRRLLVPYHRARVHGLEHIPSGAALYVGNHNGGFYTGDTYLFGAAVFHARGLADTPWTMTHDLGIALLGRWLRPLGAVPADPATAAALLARGDKVLAYPGGDADGARAWSDRHRVIFDGRVGHARLAVACGVPVIPVAAAGAHNTAVVLYDGAAVARLLRTRRWLRLTRWPLMLSLPWGLSFAPAVPYLPLPARITIAVGTPLHFDRHGPDAAADDAYVRACAGRVQAALQALLDDLTRAHPTQGSTPAA